MSQLRCEDQMASLGTWRDRRAWLQLPLQCLQEPSVSDSILGGDLSIKESFAIYLQRKILNVWNGIATWNSGLIECFVIATICNGETYGLIEGQTIPKDSMCSNSCFAVYNVSGCSILNVDEIFANVRVYFKIHPACSRILGALIFLKELKYCLRLNNAGRQFFSDPTCYVTFERVNDSSNAIKNWHEF